MLLIKEDMRKNVFFLLRAQFKYISKSLQPTDGSVTEMERLCLKTVRRDCSGKKNKTIKKKKYQCSMKGRKQPP